MIHDNDPIAELDNRMTALEEQLATRQELKSTLDELVVRQRELEPTYYGAVAAIQHLEQLIADEEKLTAKAKDKNTPHNYHADLSRAQQVYDEIRPELETLEHSIIQLRAKLAALASVESEYASLLRQKAEIIEAANPPDEVSLDEAPPPPPDEEPPSRDDKRLAILEKQDWRAIRLLILESEWRTLQVVGEAFHSPQIIIRMNTIQTEISELLESEEIDAT